jgi:hypothetical protein
MLLLQHFIVDDVRRHSVERNGNDDVKAEEHDAF